MGCRAPFARHLGWMFDCERRLPCIYVTGGTRSIWHGLKENAMSYGSIRYLYQLKRAAKVAGPGFHQLVDMNIWSISNTGLALNCYFMVYVHSQLTIRICMRGLNHDRSILRSAADQSFGASCPSHFILAKPLSTTGHSLFTLDR